VIVLEPRLLWLSQLVSLTGTQMSGGIGTVLLAGVVAMATPVVGAYVQPAAPPAT
jgi:hypothetical protein